MRQAIIVILLLHSMIAQRCEAATSEPCGVQVFDETVDFWRFWGGNLGKPMSCVFKRSSMSWSRPILICSAAACSAVSPLSTDRMISKFESE